MDASGSVTDAGGCSDKRCWESRLTWNNAKQWAAIDAERSSLSDRRTRHPWENMPFESGKRSPGRVIISCLDLDALRRSPPPTPSTWAIPNWKTISHAILDDAMTCNVLLQALVKFLLLWKIFVSSQPLWKPPLTIGLGYWWTMFFSKILPRLLTD